MEDEGGAEKKELPFPTVVPFFLASPNSAVFLPLPPSLLLPSHPAQRAHQNETQHPSSSSDHLMKGGRRGGEGRADHNYDLGFFRPLLLLPTTTFASIDQAGFGFTVAAWEKTVNVFKVVDSRSCCGERKRFWKSPNKEISQGEWRKTEKRRVLRLQFSLDFSFSWR